MNHIQIEKDANAFIKLSRKERVTKKSSLPPEVRERVMFKQERNRGISHRERGRIIFQKDSYIEHAVRFQRKLNDAHPDSVRATNLTERINRFKGEILSFYGQEALDEMESKLSALNTEQ